MAITVQSGTGTTSSASSYSVPLPASVNSGDLLLLLCDITSTQTCTSSGWSSIHSDTNANDNFHVLKKTAGGSESAPTVNIGSAVASCAMIIRIRDWDGTTGPAQITAQVSATTTPSIDPATAGSVKIAMAHSDPTTAGTKTWGSSSSDLGEIYNGTSAYITAAYKVEDSAGAITIAFAGGFVGNVGTVILSIAPLAVTVPVADFSGTPLSGGAPLEVVFTDESTNTPTSWAWDFGDGDTDTVQDPTHEYSTIGSYDVELQATNAGGSDTETKAAYVSVGEGGGPPTARFQLAFTDSTLEPLPTWTDMDDL